MPKREMSKFEAAAAIISLPDLLTLERASEQARNALAWPDEAIGEIEDGESLGHSVEPPPEVEVLDDELEQLWRETAHALIHNQGLQDFLATIVDKTRAIKAAEAEREGARTQEDGAAAA